MVYHVHADANTAKQTGRIDNSLIRFFAHLLSFVFHPLFICSYVMAFLIFIHPAAFTGFDHRTKLFRFLSILSSTTVLPAFAIFISWRLKLVRSIYMQTTKDRLIPYIIVMFFYWWAWNVFRNLPDSPPVTVHFLLGAFLAICGGWMCNIFFKISMHAFAMGGLIMFFILFAFSDNYTSGLYPSIAILIAGLVCTARFIVSDHSPLEIYAGLVIGMFAQFIAWLF